jgi:ABC-type polysaccharide/polyol phosphate transport system ATPase subunit
MGRAVTRRRTVKDPPPVDFALVAEHLSKRYRLRQKPAAAALEGRPDDVENGGDEQWIGRLDGPTTERPGMVWALRDLSLEVRRGRALAVVGANGSGKTTLLRVLAGITPPTSGRVLVRGRVAPATDFASAFLQPELTGRQNVLLLAQVMGAPRRVAERAMKPIAAFAELGPLMNVQAKRYSTGLYRRLAISTVLHLEPDILLADETFAVGDVDFRRRCAERLAEARRGGLTIVLASHDLELLRGQCDEAVWLDGGEVARRGPVDEVLSAYEATRRKRPGVPTLATLALLPAPVVEEDDDDWLDEEPWEVPPHPLEGVEALAAERAPREEPRAGSAPAGEPEPPRPARRAKRTGSADATLLGGAAFTLDGQLLDALRTDEEALLAVAFEAVTEGISVRPVVILSSGGRAVLKLARPDGIAIDEAGAYTATVRLPAGALAPGTYSARIGAWVTAGESEVAIRVGNAFELSVVAGRDDAPARHLRAAELEWDTFFGGEP